MCRYKYGNGKCSYPKNIALECVGEDSCQFLDDSEEDIDVSSDMEPSLRNEESEEERCPNTKTGVYCKKYGYFHCSGKEKCKDREEYMDHLECHQNKIQNVDIEKERD